MSSSQFDLPDVFELFGVQNAVADDGGGGGSNSNLLNSQLRDNSAAKNAASAAPGVWSDNAGDCWAGATELEHNKFATLSKNTFYVQNSSLMRPHIRATPLRATPSPPPPPLKPLPMRPP